MLAACCATFHRVCNQNRTGAFTFGVRKFLLQTIVQAPCFPPARFLSGPSLPKSTPVLAMQPTTAGDEVQLPALAMGSYLRGIDQVDTRVIEAGFGSPKKGDYIEHIKGE